jgi:hypothetical protein
MKNLMVVMLAVVLSSFAFCQDKVEVYGGAQLRSHSTNVFSQDLGYEASATYFVSPRIGLTGDFGASTVRHGNAKTFLLGPTLKLFKFGPVETSTHVLAGSERASTLGNVDYGFALAAGGAVDINVYKHFAVRPVNIDYMYTNHNSTSTNGMRYSAGIVFKF